ncbi:MAG TPA: alpha/beta hydrolase [Vicinamibacteria bacterium]|jgi:pimeloyl-ACP methyl ester carboxylesterase
MRIDVNGIEMYWEEEGDGEPLLWLHGGMGCGADWRYLFPSPPAGYRLIAPDLRGHGASTNPSGTFTFRECASDVRALLRHLSIPRVKAIGLSGGGITLLHLATAEPSAIESMVLVSAPPYFPAEARAIQRRFSESMLSDAEMERMRERHLRGESQIQELVAMARGFADSYDDVNFTPPYLATITADTLIVFGDRDPLYPVSLAFELRAAIPRSYLWVVPNGGHGPVFGDAAPRFVETALAFLGGRWAQP